jgi:hypothetical protein
MAAMTIRRIRQIPVVEKNGRLCGIVSIGDVVKHQLDEIQREADAMREYISGTRWRGLSGCCAQVPAGLPRKDFVRQRSSDLRPLGQADSARPIRNITRYSMTSRDESPPS